MKKMWVMLVAGGMLASCGGNENQDRGVDKSAENPSIIQQAPHLEAPEDTVMIDSGNRSMGTGSGTMQQEYDTSKNAGTQKK